VSRASGNLRIVLADDDEFSRQLLVRTLQSRTPHHVTAVEDGHLALELALGDEPPDALLLDWMMPTMTGTEVCRRVRAAALERQPYILLVTAKNQRDELVEGLRVGADDLLSKPVPAEVLIARLRSAERQRKGPQTASAHVLRALLRARAERDGELVVRDGEVTAHVYFHEGSVAWAHISDDRNALFELLSSDAGLDTEAARAIIDECRQTGSRLSDTLSRWGLTDRASLRNSMQLWITKKLAAIVQFSEPRTLFLPHRRRYAEEMLFDLSEVVPQIESKLRTSLPPAPPAADALATSDWDAAFVAGGSDVESERLLERVLAVEGVGGAAVLDRSLGCCFGKAGVPLNPHIVWALLQSIGVVSRHATVADAVIVTPPEIHLVRVLASQPSRFVYALVNGREVRLDAVRAELERAVDARREA
jgi:DNA-binding response OmpR family regulator